MRSSRDRVTDFFTGADGAQLSDDHLFECCSPVGTIRGADAVRAALVAPLHSAMPQLSCRTDICIEGEFKGGQWTASSGHLLGRFDAALFGVSPTGRAAYLRFGLFQRREAGRVVQTLLLLDLPALMMQAGVWPLAPPLGPMLMAPPPLLSVGDDTQALPLVEAMIAGLMRYDGHDLASMSMRDHWSENFWWYGPAPIGNFQGHEDYERGHQRPFLAAFPDRVGGDHRARIGEGGFVASTGWPSIRATHSGGDWLGLAPTGRAITMRVMDFWYASGGTLVENWVMIDLIDLLGQLGIDVFSRSRALGRSGSL